MTRIAEINTCCHGKRGDTAVAATLPSENGGTRANQPNSWTATHTRWPPYHVSDYPGPNISKIWNYGCAVSARMLATWPLCLAVQCYTQLLLSVGMFALPAKFGVFLTLDSYLPAIWREKGHRGGFCRSWWKGACGDQQSKIIFAGCFCGPKRPQNSASYIWLTPGLAPEIISLCSIHDHVSCIIARSNVTIAVHIFFQSCHKAHFINSGKYFYDHPQGIIFLPYRHF